MISKPHRNNSDFQLKYFLAGSCHTPDGAWMLLYGQKIDIEAKVRHSEAQRLRREAKIARAKKTIADPESTPADRMEAEAEIIECEAGTEIWANNLQAAKDELATIQHLMAELEPQRKYSHLPLLKANEAAQREEWLGELKARAENFIVSQGTIPHDHLATMRTHPDFEAELIPHIRRLGERLKNAPDGLELLRGNNRALLAGMEKSGEGEDLNNDVKVLSLKAAK